MHAYLANPDIGSFQVQVQVDATTSNSISDRYIAPSIQPLSTTPIPCQSRPMASAGGEIPEIQACRCMHAVLVVLRVIGNRGVVEKSRVSGFLFDHVLHTTQQRPAEVDLCQWRLWKASYPYSEVLNACISSMSNYKYSKTGASYISQSRVFGRLFDIVLHTARQQ